MAPTRLDLLENMPVFGGLNEAALQLIEVHSESDPEGVSDGEFILNST
jgi:hypothetical protein